MMSESAKMQDASAEALRRSGQGWFALVLPVALVAACAELGTAILNNSTLPMFYTKGEHVSMDVYPYLLTPFFVSEALCKSPLGVLADRYGRKPLMFFGAMVTVFTPLFLTALNYHPGAANSTAVLFLYGFLRLLDGLGGAALWPAVYAYVGDVIEENRRGAAMGVLNMVYMVGLGLCFLAGGAIDDYFGPVFTHESNFTTQVRVVFRNLHNAGHNLHDRLMDHGRHMVLVHDIIQPDLTRPGHYYPSFYLASVLFAIAACIIAVGVRGKDAFQGRGRGPDAASAAPHEESVTLADFVACLRSVPEYLGLAFTAFFGIGCIASLVKIFALDEFGLSEQKFGILTLWPMMLIAGLAIPVGLIGDKWGRTKAVRLGFGMAGIGLWGIPLVDHYVALAGTVVPVLGLEVPITNGLLQAGFVAAAAIVGIGSVMAVPSWMALLTTLTGEEQRATVIGAVTTAQAVGVFAGVLLGPFLYKHIGHIAPFEAAASLVSAACILSFVFIKDNTVRTIAAA